ncbi:hypothetical protein AC1031_005654 [Aphanomyces cochlioides]|nr:hypothetical protein AC1031_005654 [Aphanomyces cochlioides]
MRIQRDIRFDPVLAKLRIPQQEIQNVSILVKGSYRAIFRATLGETDVAIKKLLPSKAKDLSAIQEFMNELRLCACLKHPKIVKFVGMSKLQNLAVLSEFMSNGNVTGLVRKEREKPESGRKLQWFPSDDGCLCKTSFAADVIEAHAYCSDPEPPHFLVAFTFSPLSLGVPLCPCPSTLFAKVFQLSSRSGCVVILLDITVFLHEWVRVVSLF